MNYLDTERVACGCKEPYVVMSVRSHIAIISFTAVITVTPKTKILLSLRVRAEREENVYVDSLLPTSVHGTLSTRVES